MPVTKSGKKVLAIMQAQYGAKKGKEVFYASIQKGKKGSQKWHGKSKKKGKKNPSGMKSKIRKAVKKL